MSHPLSQARRRAGLSQEDLAARVGVDRSTVGRWGVGRTEPQPYARRKLTDALGLGLEAVNALFASAESERGHADDELDALELARRVAATDVGSATLAQLEAVFDDLASSYATTPPEALLDRTRAHLRYVRTLLDGHKTLREHRRLIVVGAWLSLLAAMLHVDLCQDAPAVARLRTAESLAHEAEHDEISAWALETAAWRDLTTGEYGRAVELARAARDAAPYGSSAAIQATAQEGRALARLGDSAGTTKIVATVARMTDPLAVPDRPEHHYRYDPGKATSYTSSTLAWVGDPAAVDYAREVIRTLEPGDEHGGRPRRLAVAHLDLALALIRSGELDEAISAAGTALASGRVAPSNLWRANEVIKSAELAGSGDVNALHDAYREVRTKRALRG